MADDLRFKLGRGTKIYIGLLPLNSTAEPTSAPTITEDGTGVAAGATSIGLSAALGAGVFIPSGQYLTFTDSNDEATVVQLTDDAEAGDTSLTVAATQKAIAASATSEFPVRLRGRTAANLSSDGNLTEVTDFESDGYSRGIITSVGQSLDIPGNFLPDDAGVRTAQYSLREQRQVYLWLEQSQDIPGSTTGEQNKGPGSITSFGQDTPADGVMTANMGFTFFGKPEFTLEA